MIKFILRRLLLMLLTMFIVSVAVFAITSAAPGNVARNVLGINVTAEQEASFLAQNGLDKPAIQRYIYWLAGTDWRAGSKIGLTVRQVVSADGFKEWWAVEPDGSLVQWQMEGENLTIRRRQPDGSVVEQPDNARWQIKDPAAEIERLEALKTGLAGNAQLTPADRQALEQAVEHVLAALRQAGADQAALAAALAGPEGELAALQDEAALQQKRAVQEAATKISSKLGLVQAVGAARSLAGPSASQLSPAELQSLAGSINKAAVKLRPAEPELAGQLQQAYEQLKAGDIAAASQGLAAATPRLDYLTGNLGLLAQALQAGDYQGAAAVLGSWSDPAGLPADAAQLVFLPESLSLVGEAFEAVDPDLGQALSDASESLSAGQVEAARPIFSQAAGRLSSIGYAVARSAAAAQGRAGRTFWGVDAQNHAVRWETGSGKQVWAFIQGMGWKAYDGGPSEYIPLQKGLLRGDPGISLRTGRPVADLLFIRLRNSLVLAGLAFIIVMPLALLLGIIAGLNEGKALDRILSIGGMIFSVTPEFATGIFLILIFAFWLELVPGATVFGEKAPWSKPEMLILPVLTLTLIELGYVLRITRASMVEVMKAPYIRTAFLKGLPYRQVVLKHAVRNALMAPITVIMLHVNWLLGGIVVVEVIFGYPGLGSYLLDSALFKDFNAIEAGAMILVVVAVATQLLADVVYTFINPRIRYA